MSEQTVATPVQTEPSSIASYTECCINETTGERYIYEYTNDGIHESSSLYYEPGIDQNIEPDTTSASSEANSGQHEGWSTHESYADSVADSHAQDRIQSERQQHEESNHPENHETSSNRISDLYADRERGLSRIFPLYTTEACSSIVQRKIDSPGAREMLETIKKRTQEKISWFTGKNHALRKQVAFIDMALSGKLVEKLQCVETGDLAAASVAHGELREAWPWSHEGNFMARFFGIEEATFIHALGADVIRLSECTLIAREDYQIRHEIDISWFIKQYQQKQMKGDYRGLCVEHSQLFKALRMQPSTGDTRVLRCRIVTLERIMADPATAAFRTIATGPIDTAKQQVHDLIQQVGAYYQKSGTYVMSEAATDMIARYGYDLITQSRVCLESRTDYIPELTGIPSVSWQIIITNIKQGPLPLAQQELADLEQQISDHCKAENISPAQQHDFLVKTVGYDICALARDTFESREDYQKPSSSSTSDVTPSVSTNDLYMRPAQESITDALYTCHTPGELADRLDLIANEVFSQAEQRNYDVHPEVHEHVGILIHTIRVTQDAQAVVFHISYVERVLTGIQIQTQPHTTPQPTLLERSPELLMRALEKFVTGLNPVTQVKNAVEFWVSTAHFVADVTVGTFYLTAEQYNQRVQGFWNTLEAMSPSNLSQLTAEQWVDMAAQMAADMVYARGVASTIAYLKEIDAVAKAQRKVSCIADKFKRGLDHVIGKEPILVTTEGVIWKAPQELQETMILQQSADKVRSGAREIIRDTGKLLEKEAEIVAKPLDYGHSVVQYEKLKQVLRIEEITSVVKVTKHGLEQLLKRGFSGEEIMTLITKPSIIKNQADGAKAFIVQLANNKFNIMILNEARGDVVTAMKNLSLKSIQNLGKNYGWTL